MVAETHTAVDVEKAARQWARDQGFQAWFGATGRRPEVVLTRVGGTDEQARIQFDCWSDTKAGAATLAADLATALTGLTGYDHDGIRLHGASWEGTRWLPDDVSDTPRYILDAIIFTTAL